MDQTWDNESVNPRRIELDEPNRNSVEDFLRKLGADEYLIEVCRQRINDVDVRGLVNRFKSYAEKNSSVLLGALSALALGVAAEEIVRRRTPKRSASTKRAPSKRSSKKRASSKRTLIEPHPGDKRYVRRDARGRIKESVDVGRSLSADRKRQSKRRAKRGEGDRGDR